MAKYDPASGEPAPSWYRPSSGPLAPYQPGNLEALKHGSYSPRRVDEQLEPYVRGILAEASWLDAKEYASTVLALARCERRIDLLEEWLGEVGILDESGTPRSAYERALVKEERHAAKLRESMGMTPRGKSVLPQAMVRATKRDTAPTTPATTEIPDNLRRWVAGMLTRQPGIHAEDLVELAREKHPAPPQDLASWIEALVAEVKSR